AVPLAAFFDVDGTLIARNSAPLYIRHLRRTGQARRRDLARTLYYVWRYKLGLLDIERAVAVSLGWIRGRDEATVRADCQSWYERIVNPEPRLRRVAARRGWPVLQLGPRDEAPTFGEGEGRWRTNACGAGPHPSAR